MKLALSLLFLVAYAHAIPITKDTRTKVDTPTVIVGSSQVDGKKDGKVTLHLDQRSQIPEPQVPVVSVPKTVQVVEEPKKQEPDVLSARNDIIPPKSEETIRTPQSEDTRPVKTELGARNQVPLQTVQVPSQDTPAIRQVVEPQVTQQQVIPGVQRPTTVVVEEVPISVISSQPAILVLTQEPVRIPVGGQEIPQAVVESVIVPEGPQVIAQPIEIPEVPRVVAVLEERSTPVIQTTPVVQTSPVASNVLPVKESIEPQTKVVPKQQGGESRNLRVEQVPVKAPIVGSSPIQKQVPVIKSEIQSQQQQQIVPEVVKPKVQEPISRVVLEERRSEEVRPIRVESLVVPEKAIIRNEPAAVIPAVQESSIRTTETQEPAQIQPIRVSEPTLVKPIRVESLVVPEQPIVISPVVQSQETSVRASPEIRERVQVQPIQTTQIRASDICREPEQVQGSIRAETSPVVQSKQTNIRNEVPSVKVQLPEEKLQ